jgi:hypothetical protein
MVASQCREDPVEGCFRGRRSRVADGPDGVGAAARAVVVDGALPAGKEALPKPIGRLASWFMSRLPLAAEDALDGIELSRSWKSLPSVQSQQETVGAAAWRDRGPEKALQKRCSDRERVCAKLTGRRTKIGVTAFFRGSTVSVDSKSQPGQGFRLHQPLVKNSGEPSMPMRMVATSWLEDTQAFRPAMSAGRCSKAL